MRFFDDFTLGETIKTRARTVTESDIVSFAGLSGDFYPLHVDAEYAQKTLFKQRIAHGFLVLSIASGLFPLYELAIVAFYGMDQVRFLKPTFIGDTLHCELEVENLEDRGEKGGIVTFHQSIGNQRGETVCSLQLKLLLAKKS